MYIHIERERERDRERETERERERKVYPRTPKCGIDARESSGTPSQLPLTPGRTELADWPPAFPSCSSCSAVSSHASTRMHATELRQAGEVPEDSLASCALSRSSRSADDDVLSSFALNVRCICCTQHNIFLSEREFFWDNCVCYDNAASGDRVRSTASKTQRRSKRLSTTQTLRGKKHEHT